MQIEVSVKNPLRGSGSCPRARRSAGSVGRQLVATEAHLSLLPRRGDSGGRASTLSVSTVAPARDWYSATSRSSSSPCGRRPGRMSQDPALDSWICTFGIERHAEQVVGGVAADHRVAAHPPVIRQPDLVDGAAADDQRGHPLGDQHPGLDRRPGRDDGGPAVGLEATLGRQLRARPRRTSPAAARRGTAASGSSRPRCGAR